MPPLYRRLGWSPRRTLRAGHRTHPNVWTFYLFLAFGLGFSLLVGTTWGYAQWATGRPPWALAIVPTVALLGALLYFASQVGQALGGEQMDHLWSALDELVQ